MTGTNHDLREGIYDAPHLARNPANFTALTPLGFLARAAAVYPDKLAVIDGARRFTYREFYERCGRFGDALRRRGYATRALALILPVARETGLRRLEITCDEDNEPSRRVILANGGVQIGSRPQPQGTMKTVFRIDLWRHLP